MRKNLFRKFHWEHYHICKYHFNYFISNLRISMSKRMLLYSNRTKDKRMNCLNMTQKRCNQTPRYHSMYIYLTLESQCEFEY